LSKTISVACLASDIGYVLVSGETAIAETGDKVLSNPEVGRLFLGG
jgi:branched-chain amino acid transport system ATP-binding protein